MSWAVFRWQAEIESGVALCVSKHVQSGICPVCVQFTAALWALENWMYMFSISLVWKAFLLPTWRLPPAWLLDWLLGFVVTQENLKASICLWQLKLNLFSLPCLRNARMPICVCHVHGWLVWTVVWFSRKEKFHVFVCPGFMVVPFYNQLLSYNVNSGNLCAISLSVWRWLSPGIW